MDFVRKISISEEKQYGGGLTDFGKMYALGAL